MYVCMYMYIHTYMLIRNRITYVCIVDIIVHQSFHYSYRVVDLTKYEIHIHGNHLKETEEDCRRSRGWGSSYREADRPMLHYCTKRDSGSLRNACWYDELLLDFEVSRGKGKFHIDREGEAWRNKLSPRTYSLQGTMIAREIDLSAVFRFRHSSRLTQKLYYGYMWSCTSRLDERLVMKLRFTVCWPKDTPSPFSFTYW